MTRLNINHYLQKKGSLLLKAQLSAIAHAVMGEILKMGKPYYPYKNTYIYHDDFLITEVIEPNSVNLVVTSPPYNVDIHYDSYADDIPYDKYLEFTERWLRKCYKLKKKDGRLCLNIPLDRNKGGQQSVYADITYIAKEAGWKYFSTIVWNEQNISRRTAWG